MLTDTELFEENPYYYELVEDLIMGGEPLSDYKVKFIRETVVSAINWQLENAN